MRETVFEAEMDELLMWSLRLSILKCEHMMQVAIHGQGSVEALKAQRRIDRHEEYFERSPANLDSEFE
jgi:hypothetical protein